MTTYTIQPIIPGVIPGTSSILEKIFYSSKPRNINANTLWETEEFDSIEILEEGTVIDVLKDINDDDVLVLTNWTGYEWNPGAVLTWSTQMLKVRANKTIKINRVKQN